MISSPQPMAVPAAAARSSTIRRIGRGAAILARRPAPRYCCACCARPTSTRPARPIPRCPIGETRCEGARMSDSPIRADLQLSCQPSKAGNLLIFPYRLENQGPAEVYAMHALPSVDPATGEAKANDSTAVVIAAENGDAIIGKFAAPLPSDRRIAVPVFPLARRLPAGTGLDGRIEIP